MSYIYQLQVLEIIYEALVGDLFCPKCFFTL